MGRREPRVEAREGVSRSAAKILHKKLPVRYSLTKQVLRSKNCGRRSRVADKRAMPQNGIALKIYAERY